MDRFRCTMCAGQTSPQTIRRRSALMFRSSKRLYVYGGIIAVGLAVAVISSFPRTSAAQNDPNNPQSGGASPQKGKPLDTKDISLDQAHAVLAAAVKKAQELKIAQNVAVVDAG